MSLDKLHLVAVIFTGSLFSTLAQAQESFAVTPQESALCSSPVFDFRDQTYKPRADPGHWCDCVRFRYRAIRKIGTQSVFRHNLQEAVDGCDYVLGHAPLDYHGRPRVHVDKGLALRMLRDTGGAVREFSKAIELNPYEVSAYSELADIQHEAGKRSGALEVVTLGLRHVPGSKELQRAFLKFGGKEPFPEPFVKADPQPQAVVEESQPSTVPAPKVDAVVGDETAQAAETLVDEDEVSASGRSCRYCPPEEILQRWSDFISPEKPAGSP